MEMKRMKIKRIITAGFITVLLFILIGCGDVYKGPVSTDTRTIYVDFKDTIFNEPDDEVLANRGLGINTITVSVATKEGLLTVNETTETIKVEDVDTGSGFGYSQKEITVTGELVSITATAGNFLSSVDESSDDWDIHGWTVFANSNKFKIGYSVNPDVPSRSLFQVTLCPRGESAPEIRIDSGVQTVEGKTDRWEELEEKQIALEVALAEYPADISYDVFTGVTVEDLSYEYNEATNFDAYYDPNAWTDSWTYDEITSTGRKVGTEVYKLERYNSSGPYSVVEPEAEGKQGIILDFSASTDENLTDKYMLIGIILYYGGLAVPVDVFSIGID